MKKNYIYAPGPVQVPADVLLAGAMPTVHHRSADFPPIFDRAQENLRKVFGTANPVAVLASSGTGAVESAMISTVSPGEKILVFNGGKFGERWVKIAKAYGMNAVELAEPWGHALSPERAAAELAKHPDARALVVTQTETSTGSLCDIKALAALTQKSDAILIVDAVSAFLAEELRQDEWGVDVVCTGSQKALMLPPGLGFASANKRAQERMATCKTPRFYLDLARYIKELSGEERTPFTPAVNLIYSLDTTLQNIVGEGVEEVWARHRVLARACRAAVKALGLKLFPVSPSVVVHVVELPAGAEFKTFNSALKSRGITIAGGQDQLKGKVFRFSTLGDYNAFDAVTIISAVEFALKACGHPFALGTGVAAAMEVLQHHDPKKGWAAADAATAAL